MLVLHMSTSLPYLLMHWTLAVTLL